MPSRFRAWRALALLLLLPLAARAEEGLPRAGAATELVRLGPAVSALLTLPPQAGPGRRLPVAVLLADAEGTGPRTALYGERLLRNGMALLEPDFAAVAGDKAVPPASRLRLAAAAIAADARLDAGRVAVLGLGEGARVALIGLAAGAPVAAAALLYPGCDADLAGVARAAVPARVLLLHGDADAANPPAACARLAASFPAPVTVLHRVLAGAGYGWDAFSLVRPGGAVRLPSPSGSGRTLAWPDEILTLVAADRVLGFVLAALGSR